MEDQEEDSELPKSARVIMIVAITGVVVAVSVAFELLRDYALENSSPQMVAIISSLLGELTNMGIIGLVMFILKTSDALDKIG